MNVHKRPIGEASPYGCSSFDGDGNGNCEWKTFASPYPIMIVPMAKRR